jgi:hypothetical protein
VLESRGNAGKVCSTGNAVVRLSVNKHGRGEGTKQEVLDAASFDAGLSTLIPTRM